ncbi:PEP-CTERM sorting domain-containing protein [Aeoliella sp. SH292]|uniref:PEP-CTERM sorting domain-containing protein n=1 Tax=Aeoliella sp. SH292 TaxID=3454464 RepID=UPI003F9C15FC
MTFARWFVALASVMVVASPAMAVVLIDPVTNNGSFELADGVVNTTKIPVWDGTPNIDNWSVWTGVSTADNDSGVQLKGAQAATGDMIAFFQPGNAAHNMTTWNAAAGDLFNFSWDHIGNAGAAHSVVMVYDNAGTITALEASRVFSTGTLETISGSFVVPAGSPAIGKPMGIGVRSTGNWPELDNFILTVNEGGPIPGDVNGDNLVNMTDYGIISSNFGLSPATKEQGDLTGADIVDLEDFLLWRANNPYPPAGIGAELGAAAVPEPATVCLGALGVMLLAARRARRS